MENNFNFVDLIGKTMSVYMVKLQINIPIWFKMDALSISS